MEKIGLVLEGGASRGVFTAGVLDYWMEQGITFPYVVVTHISDKGRLKFVGRNRIFSFYIQQALHISKFRHIIDCQHHTFFTIYFQISARNRNITGNNRLFILT